MIRTEKLTDVQKVRVGYFSFYNSKWVFVNESLSSLKDVTEDKQVPLGSIVEINDGKRLLLSKEEVVGLL